MIVLIEPIIIIEPCRKREKLTRQTVRNRQSDPIQTFAEPPRSSESALGRCPRVSGDVRKFWDDIGEFVGHRTCKADTGSRRAVITAWNLFAYNPGWSLTIPVELQSKDAPAIYCVASIFAIWLSRATTVS